jgi:glycosyltransferase involved in cell wall biosynthesis
MSKPIITVFIPVYNGALFIFDAINSVLSQEGPSFELLIIDDASQDDTPIILKKMIGKDSRIRVLFNDSNRGVSFTSNRAIDEARGDFLIRLDADDISVPGRHKAQFNILKDETIHVVGSNIQIFGDGVKNKLVYFPQNDADIKAKFIFCANNIANPASAFNLSFIRKNNIRFNEDLKVAEDLNFWIDCMNYGAKFFNIQNTYVNYRIHSKQSSRQINEMRIAQFNIRNRLLKTWFPKTKETERNAIANFFSGETLSREYILMGLGALHLLTSQPRDSVNGESTELLFSIFKKYMDAGVQALHSNN